MTGLPTAADYVFAALVFVAHDPTSHNLWPFEYVIFGVPCAVMWWLIELAARAA